MAPFNQRQIGYIQAIAGRQQHRTLICGHDARKISSHDSVSDASLTPYTLDSDRVKGYGYNGSVADAKSLLLFTWLLDHVEAVYDARTEHNDKKLTTGDISGLQLSSIGMGPYKKLEVFDAPVEGSHAFKPEGDPSHETVVTAASAAGALVRNPQLIPSTVRATPDGFLNSTNVKFRFTLPRTVIAPDVSSGSDHAMGQDHFEFRWIVWRSKNPTLHYKAGVSPDENHTNLEAIRDGVSFRNPGYDLFMGQTGRKRGFIGYTLNADLDKDKVQSEGEAYSGPIWNGSSEYVTEGTLHSAEKPSKEADFTVDDLMTARLNKDDYVIMKDVRFFLGKEHGKSHFEDTLHWDWNDPIDTVEENVLASTTLNNKNYRWHMTLLGTSGGLSECALNVRCLWTTKMESG